MNHKSKLGRNTLALVGLALVSVAVIASGCASAPAAAGGNSGGSVLNTISVTGSGEADGAPDVANVQLGIDVSESEVGAAIQKANDVMKAVQDAVKGKGIDVKDMQTVNFNVYPEDIYDKDTGQPTGERRYHVQNFLNVKVRDINTVGDIIDAGLTAGATNVSGLTFSVDDTSALESDARGKALKDAQKRAQELADGVGMKLGKPVIVSETLGGGPVYPGPLFSASVADSGKGAGAPTISIGQQTVTVMVNVTYAISQ